MPHAAPHPAPAAPHLAEPRVLSLGLQGGGSHGAFTWGVLERLLDDPQLHVPCISGTSAGAMNAVVLAHGYQESGRAGAKAALERFWRQVSEAARFSPIQRSLHDRLTGNWSLDTSPGYVFFDIFSRLFSPYEVNPANVNPLRDILAGIVDFARLRDCPIKLYINATQVRTGLPRLFRNAELSIDAVLASACLPQMHQAIEIDGEAYWDGGFSGNPLLTPIIHEQHGGDILLVQINPIERPGVPRHSREIINRLNEISFNASLKKELRVIAILQHLLSRTNPPEGIRAAAAQLDVRLHRITTDKMVELGASSKLSGEWDFLCMLRAEGHRCADAFLTAHRTDLGQRSTYDLTPLLDIFLKEV